MDSLNFYRLASGKIWSIKEAKFVTEFDELSTVNLIANGVMADEDYLKRTLEFYGFPIGDELITEEELAKNLRQKRDLLLTETDYLLMSDYPISDKDLDLVKIYRQALRDVPGQAGFPRSVEWPKKPGVIS